MFLHQGDEVSFGEERWGRRWAFVDINLAGHELVPLVVMPQLLVRPTIVRVHFEVATIRDDQAVGRKLRKTEGEGLI